MDQSICKNCWTRNLLISWTYCNSNCDLWIAAGFHLMESQSLWNGEEIGVPDYINFMLHRVVWFAPFCKLLNEFNIGLIILVFNHNNIHILQNHQVIKTIFFKINKKTIALQINMKLFWKVKSLLHRIDHYNFITFRFFIFIGVW